jgi:hypothetical protein
VKTSVQLLGCRVGAEQGQRVSWDGAPAVETRLGAPCPASFKRRLSAERYLVQFTASAELGAKLQRAKELLSHSVPGGDLPLLVERALDALIERELKRRTGDAHTARGSFVGAAFVGAAKDV